MVRGFESNISLVYATSIPYTCISDTTLQRKSKESPARFDFLFMRQLTVITTRKLRAVNSFHLNKV